MVTAHLLFLEQLMSPQLTLFAPRCSLSVDRVAGRRHGCLSACDPVDRAAMRVASCAYISSAVFPAASDGIFGRFQSVLSFLSVTVFWSCRRLVFCCMLPVLVCPYLPFDAAVFGVVLCPFQLWAFFLSLMEGAGAMPVSLFRHR